MLNGPFAIINADDFYGRDSYRKLSKYLDVMVSENVNACMVGFMLAHTLSKYGTVTRGICKSNDAGMLDGIVETSGIGSKDGLICYEDASGHMVRLNGDELASMNMWGFTPDVLDLLKERFGLFLDAHSRELKSEYVIPTAVNTLVEEDKVSVKVLSTTSDWFGITNPADKKDVVARIAELVRSGQYPENLWKEDAPIAASDSRRDA